MCIADLTGSISTEFGNFNSVQMSMSAFPTSLGPYNWLPGTVAKETTATVTGADSLVLDPNINGIQVGMNWQASAATPTSGVVTATNPSDNEIDLSPLIEIAAGELISFAHPTFTCSIFNLSENVQTKDRDNACVDFLLFFLGSGSSSPHGNPTTHIFTDDGFDFAVTRDQEILVWQGGATNQNTFVPAHQLSIGTPLVCWQNDIYQYVQVDSMSFGDNNSVAVNWTTTGTNSYQLENRVVLRGFIDDFCSCKPSASINDIPCESTLSYCVSASSPTDQFVLHFSGSDSGGWDGSPGTESTTFKAWSVVAGPEDDIVFSTTLNNSNQELTMSVTDLPQPSNLQICYTESRILGPVELFSNPYTFDQSSLYVGGLTSGSQFPDALVTSGPNTGQGLSDEGLHSGSANDLAVNFTKFFSGVDTPIFKYVFFNTELDQNTGVSNTIFHMFVQATGSHANLPGQSFGFTSQSYTHLLQPFINIHLFASDSADNGQLSPSHPSYSNAGYSLAWKINSLWTASAGSYGLMNKTADGMRSAVRSPYDFGTFGTTAGYSGIPSDMTNRVITWPSASYAYRPTNIQVATGIDPISITNDFEDTYHGDRIFFVSPQTGSRCDVTGVAASRNLNWNISSSTTTSPFHIGTFQSVGGNGAWGLEDTESLFEVNAVCPSAGTSSYGSVAVDSCCFNLRLNRKPRELFNTSSVCQTGFGTEISLTQDLAFENADSVVFEPASGSIVYFKDFVNGTPTRLIVDTQSFAKGKITLCYTASSTNPNCTNDADEIAALSPLSTPDCCTAISGCVDVFFHPGFTAGQDGIHCYPTISLAGTPPIFTFTDTVVSQPTWSLASAAIQDDEYEILPMTPSDIANPSNHFAKFQPFDVGSSLTPFGAISEFTNSYVTEIHLEMANQDPTDNERHYGWFTMSCQVSNGPCTFTDTATHYAAKTFANAGPDRSDCLGGTRGPLTPSGLIMLQATSSTEGFWSYVDPPGALINPQMPVIEDPTDKNSAFRIALCGGRATIKWTQQSGSSVPINGEQFTINCEATDLVNIRLDSSQKPSKIVGHMNTNIDSPAETNKLVTMATSVYTSSFSQSSTNGTANRGPFAGSLFVANFPHKVSTKDNLFDLHVFTEGKTIFKLNYTHHPEVVSDNITFNIPSGLSAYPLPVYGGTVGDPVNEGRMFENKGIDGGAVINGVELLNSGSSGGLLTQSKAFGPGLLSSTLSIHTSSLIQFSGSSSASFAAPSGSLFGNKSADKTYYLAHLTASFGDNCICEAQGTQARIFMHMHATDFKFVTQSNRNFRVQGSSSNAPSAFMIPTQIVEHLPDKLVVAGADPAADNHKHYMVEPVLGVKVPVYRDIFALNFISESVVMGTTASSVIYSRDNTNFRGQPAAPFLTCSFKQNGNFYGHMGADGTPAAGLIPPTNKSSSLQSQAAINRPPVYVPQETLFGQAYPLHSVGSAGIFSQAAGGTSGFVGIQQIFLDSNEPLYRQVLLNESEGQFTNPTADQIARQFHQNPIGGMADSGFSLNFKWTATEIAVYGADGSELSRPEEIPAAVITGSFLDTMTSESFIEAPTFVPAQRQTTQSLGNPNAYLGYVPKLIGGNSYVDGLESGGNGALMPYFTPGPAASSLPWADEYKPIVTQSVEFVCSASVRDFNGRLIKQYLASQSVMFIDTDPVRGG